MVSADGKFNAHKTLLKALWLGIYIYYYRSNHQGEVLRPSVQSLYVASARSLKMVLLASHAGRQGVCARAHLVFALVARGARCARGSSTSRRHDERVAHQWRSQDISVRA